MKTAVEWFVEQLPIRILNQYHKEIEQTKAIEKEQMLDFGLYVKKNGWVGCKIEDLFEDYNNQNK
jgi:hypothetical protein